jgi:hypothetical protein
MKASEYNPQFNLTNWLFSTLESGFPEKINYNTARGHPYSTAAVALNAVCQYPDMSNYLFDKKKVKLFFTVFFRVLKRAV